MSSIAIKNAQIVPITSSPFVGSIVAQDGRITALGEDIELPAAVPQIDASGMWLLPGFVEAHGHIGIHEEGHGWAGDDTNETTDPNGSRFRAIDAIHPTDQGFQDALAGGVTTAVIKPGSANPIGGQTVAIKTWGRIVDDMVVKQPCSMKSALGENPKNYHGQVRKSLPNTRLGVASVLRDAFTAAQNYSAQRDEAAASGKAFDRDLASEALAQVLSGELPWCQHCHRVDDIATAIRISEEFGYRLIVNHATEGHLIADVLAAKQIPVIVGPIFGSRLKQELDLRTAAGPGILHAAGVQVAITTDHPVVPINYLVYEAILCMKEGLPHDAALAAISINPARMLGLDDRVGSLEVGKDADFVLWSGDPLDFMSRALHTYVAGREVYTWNPEIRRGETVDPYRALTEMK